MNCGCEKNCKTVINRKGEQGIQGPIGPTGPAGTDLPLVWEDLIPYLEGNWTNYVLPSKQPEFAYDSIKKLLYFRGLITSPSAVTGSDVFNIPVADLNGDNMTSSFMPVFLVSGGVVSQATCQLGDLGGLNFKFIYTIGPTGVVNIILDALTVVRLD